MKRALVLTLLAACFGEGPTPGTPAGVTVLAYTNLPGDPNFLCNNSRYFSSVALSPTGGIAISIPYIPEDNNCGNIGMGMQQSGPANVVSFARDGSGSSLMTPIPSTNGYQILPLVADNTGAIASFAGNQLTIGPAGKTLAFSQNPMMQPGGFVDDGGTWFVAAWSPNTGPPTIDDPNFPQGTNNISSGPPQFGQLAYDGTGRIMPISVPDMFLCDEMKNCLADTNANLYYLSRNPQGMGTLWQYPKQGTQASDAKPAATFDVSGALTVVSLSGSQVLSRVVWAVSNDWRTVGAAPFCAILSFDEATGMTTPLLMTTNFGCLDVAMSPDGMFVYFTIADEEQSNGQLYLHGLGVGRVGPGGTVETLAMHVTGVARGPRHLVAGQLQLFLVDPEVIVRVVADSVAGMNDFPP